MRIGNPRAAATAGLHEEVGRVDADPEVECVVAGRAARHRFPCAAIAARIDLRIRDVHSGAR